MLIFQIMKDATEDGSNSQLNETTKEFLTRPVSLKLF